LLLPGDTRLQAIGFANDTLGWVGGYGRGTFGKSLITRDGGITWSSFELGENLNRIRFSRDSFGIAVGRKLLFYDRF
jgi:photosystem II stability/assembly factor-like uncharacterized protein